ncbi:hypothetical protein Tco_0359583 [Tanacetum coccineum]
MMNREYAEVYFKANSEASLYQTRRADIKAMTGFRVFDSAEIHCVQASTEEHIKKSLGSTTFALVLSFINQESSDIEDSHVNDRYAKGMHAVPPPMTGIYIPSGPDKEIDDSQFTYGPKQI